MFEMHLNKQDLRMVLVDHLQETKQQQQQQQQNKNIEIHRRSIYLPESTLQDLFSTRYDL